MRKDSHWLPFSLTTFSFFLILEEIWLVGEGVTTPSASRPLHHLSPLSPPSLHPHSPSLPFKLRGSICVERCRSSIGSVAATLSAEGCWAGCSVLVQGYGGFFEFFCWGLHWRWFRVLSSRSPLSSWLANFVFLQPLATRSIAVRHDVYITKYRCATLLILF